MRVLVVEPDQRTAQLIKLKLQASDLQVDLATSAQSAIHSADAHQPDVVISELLFADQNSLAFLHELRSYSDWASIPVIIHSHIPPEDAAFDSAIWPELGVVDYLYKPTTSLEKLKSRIQMVLN